MLEKILTAMKVWPQLVQAEAVGRKLTVRGGFA